MMKTKVLCLTLCLALLMAALPLALGEADAPEQTRRLRLGSSIYTIEIDRSFTYGDVTEADVAASQVAYLYSDSFAVDFDVYQYSVAGEPLTLAEYVAEAAGAHGNAEGVVADGEINGIPVGWYRSVETFNGADYRTVTYVMDNGDGYVEVVFWLDGEDAEAEAQGIINTLDYDYLAPVRLGTSPYWIFCSASFREGGMTSEDVADHQVAYWVSDETQLDFDVYQFSKEGLPGDLADYVAQKATEYNASAVETHAAVNGIPVGWYRTVEDYEGVEYKTLTCVADAGQEYVEIVFWLDGLTAEAEADTILQSLWMEETDEEEALIDGLGEWAEEAAGEVDEALEAAGEWAEEAADQADEALEAAGEWAGEAADEVNEALRNAGESAEGTAAIDGADASAQLLRLGTSQFTIVVPASFTEGEMTQEDIEDDQVAYYYSNETLLDFDIYQFSKDGYPNDLAVYAEEEASGYNSVSELVTDGEINGVRAAWYRTVEMYGDAEFNTLTYILDGGDEYVDVCFWLDGDNADAEADAIIRTLAVSPAAEPLEGEGAVAVEAQEETSVAQRTGTDEAEAAFVEEPVDDSEAGDQPDDSLDEADGEPVGAAE